MTLCTSYTSLHCTYSDVKKSVLVKHHQFKEMCYISYSYIQIDEDCVDSDCKWTWSLHWQAENRIIARTNEITDLANSHNCKIITKAAEPTLLFRSKSVFHALYLSPTAYQFFKRRYSDCRVKNYTYVQQQFYLTACS